MEVKFPPGILSDSAGSIKLDNDQKLTVPSDAAVTNPAYKHKHMKKTVRLIIDEQPKSKHNKIT